MVGGGHNGLTAAAYLARAGQSVLVLERREQLGGACTLEQPFPDERYLVSPCAYVVGLLDDLVVAGAAAWSATATGCSPPTRTCGARSPTAARSPSSLDHDRTAEHLRANGFSERDIDGLLAYEDTFERHPAGAAQRAPRRHLARLLAGREPSSSRCWATTRADLDRLRGVDRRPRSTATSSDQRLKDALFGQGVIGAWAGPRDPGHGLGQADALTRAT